ncbi:putative enoyl CoA hydratase [Mortierella sp. GBA39]|nr:putative enoyl CoA hydratase [Mortierella sp. GBA39]
MSASAYNYETVKVSFPAEFVAHVELNRPKKLNAINDTMWTDIGAVFNQLRDDEDVRAIVLSGSGRCFTSGLDLFSLNLPIVPDDASRTAFKARPYIKASSRTLGSINYTPIPSPPHPLSKLQDSLTAIEICDKAVVAAIHGPCIGGGIDITTACDIRYASKDAYFSVKEVDIGLAADVGSLQRLPKVVGNIGWVRELCLTGRNFDSKEALEQGFISKVVDDHKAVLAAAIATATLIAEKSPVAAIGTKHILNYSRDHTVQEGLDYVATWNQVMLTTPDLPKAAAAQMSKTKAVFAKL